MADQVIRIIVEPDTGNFQRELDSDLSRVKGEVAVSANTDEFERNLAAARKQAEADGIDLGVDADTTGAKVSVETFRKGQESDSIEIPVELDRKSLTNALKQQSAALAIAFRKNRAQFRAYLKDNEKDLKKSLEKVKSFIEDTGSQIGKAFALAAPATLISIVGGLTSAFVDLAGGLIAILGPLLQVGAATAALPAILLATVVAAKSVQFAFLGVGEALGGINDEIDEDAFAKLTPEAQKLVRTLDKLKPAIRGIQRTLQAEMFPAIDTSITRFGMFGQTVKNASKSVGDAIGDIISTFTEAATTPFFAAAISLQIRELAPNIRLLGAALTNIALTLLRVVTAATPFTTFLLTGFKDWTASILQAATGSSTMNDFFLQLRGTVSLVLGLLGNVTGLLFNIFKAATPTGLELLTLLNDATAAARAFTGSAEGQTKLAAFFQSQKPAIIEIAKLIKAAGAAFIEFAGDPSTAKLIKQIREELLPSAVDLVRTLQKGLPGVISTLASIMDLAVQLAPAFAQAPLIIKKVTDAIGKLLKENPLLKQVVITLLAWGSAFAAIAGPLKFFGKLMAPLAKSLTKLAIPLAKLVFQFGKFTILRAIIPVLTYIGGAFVAVAAAIGIVPIAIAAVVIGLGILIYKSQTVRDFLIFLGVQLLTFFTSIPGWVMKAVQAVAGVLVTFHGHIMAMRAKTLALLLKFGLAIVNFFRNTWTKAVNIAKAIVIGYFTFVASIPGRILGFLISLGQKLWSLAQAAWTRFRSATVTVVTAVIDFVRSIPGRITAAIGAVGRLLYNKGSEILDGFFDGLKAGWEKVRKWLSGIGDKIKKLKGPIEVDRTLLVDEGKAIMDGFHTGLKDRWSGVEDFLSERGGFIKGLLTPGGLKEAMDSIGKLFSGEISIGDVKGKLDELTMGGLHPTSGLADTTAMANMIARRFGLVITSIQRAVGSLTASGNISQHGLGQAADMDGAISSLDAMAKQMSLLVGRVFKQVIWRNRLWQGGYMNMASYIPGHAPGDNKHAHLGWIPRRKGGRIGKGKNYFVGEDGPEPFIPDQNGFMMSNAKLGRLLALGQRVTSLELGGGRSPVTASGGRQLVQENHFALEVNHGVNDASSLMAILSTRLDAFARASLPNLAGGIG